MENNKRAIDALEKIKKVLDEVADIFPNIKKGTIKISAKKYNTPFDTLKKISRIVVNYNESNAEIKLENVIKYLGSISHK